MTVAETRAFFNKFLDKRMNEIDDLLFKDDTGQIVLDSLKRKILIVEADAIHKTVADEVGKNGNKSAEEFYNLVQRKRSINRLAATAERHMQLKPESNPKDDQIIAASFQAMEDGSKTNAEIAKDINSIFAYMFVQRTEQEGREIADTPPKQGLFRRLIDWKKH